MDKAACKTSFSTEYTEEYTAGDTCAKDAMSHDPLEDILQGPNRERDQRMHGPGRIQSIRSNKHYSQIAVVHDASASLGMANPTELTSAHLDELVALARRHKNRGRIFWIADHESPSLRDGEDHQGVRVNIRIKGGCHTTLATP